MRADVRVIWPIGILNDAPGLLQRRHGDGPRPEHRQGGPSRRRRRHERAGLPRDLRHDHPPGERGAMSPTKRETRARQLRGRRSQQGFTLVELTVALVAGLIVALGIMGLSRESTRTFHEEMRVSAAEANLRTAVDRLRADLSRAGYMSTSNIFERPDDRQALPAPVESGACGHSWGSGARLASIRLEPGGSANEHAAVGPERRGPRRHRDRRQHDDERRVPGLPDAPCRRWRRRRRLHEDFPHRGDAVGVPAARNSRRQAQQAQELNNAFQPSPVGRPVHGAGLREGHEAHAVPRHVPGHAHDRHRRRRAGSAALGGRRSEHAGLDRSADHVDRSAA